ncbi:hypothetical protein [Sphingomonas sp.]|uniref:hypothetical protein n=1 Tax=Sphingomonas sp. TaxID=28214 RepID=UPI00257C3320|nr:hypothetical protein [Sphingomonas sp.]
MTEDNECTPPMSVEMIGEVLDIAERHRLAMKGIAVANDNARIRREAPSPLSAEARSIPLAEVAAWLNDPRVAGAVRVPGEDQ